jgi:DNA-directed RNA polymerase specialized sigma24 family protein
MQPAWRSSFARSNRPTIALCLTGAALMALGLALGKAPGASPLIFIGAGQVTLAVLLPRVTRFDVGPSGVGATLAEGDAEFRVVFEAEADRLQRFAYLMCGDNEQARALVEDALGKTRVQQRRLSGEERGSYALRTLLELVENAEERRWLRGPTPARPASRRRRAPPDEEDPAIVSALAELGLPARAVAVLCWHWDLNAEEIAAVVKRPTEEVRKDLSRAREQLRARRRELA